MNKHLFSLSALCLALSGCMSGNDNAKTTNTKNDIWPKITNPVKPDAKLETKIDALLAQMTLEQKIAQMIQPEIRNITVEDMRRYGFGSYLNGGGSFPNGDKHATPEDWIKLANDMYMASIDDSLDGSTIPTMWGTDAVHGHNNVIGATLFPHNIGLGAANNPELMEQIAAITAKEVMVTGIDWVFAPTVAVVQDDRWGRTYESYSEDPSLVRNYAASVVKGLQGEVGKDFLGDERVISTVKHFVGDGGTVDGDDQGNNLSSEQDLFDIHAQGYVGGLNVGAQSVMASFNSWHGEKVHGSKYLLNDVLKVKMGFDGFIVGDWNGHGQVAGCSNESCAQSINAGLDIFMVPSDWKALMENTIAQVKTGEISQSRIDDAVRRILRVKLRAGLFDKPRPKDRALSGKTELIGQASHREVAAQAVRESLVLLKNNQQLLPLSPKQRILVAGDAADNIGKQSGGWTITWQGTNNQNSDFPGGSSILDGLRSQVNSAGGILDYSLDGSFSEKPDVAIVVFGEEPYAEGHGDRATLEYQAGDKRDLALLNKLKAENIPVVAVFISGRPMWVNAELNASTAFVAAWLPGSEGAAIADLLLRKADNSVNVDFKGKLPFSWPIKPNQHVDFYNKNSEQPLFEYGYGLTTTSNTIVPNDLPEQFERKAGDVKSVSILEGEVKKPWQAWLFSGDNSEQIMSSTLSLEGINYRTIDKVIQEDARKISITGEHAAGLRFASKSYFREDLSNLVSDTAQLTFDVKVDSKKAKDVWLTMNCEGTADKPGSCHSKMDISHLINAKADGQWHTLSVDLACFTQQGIKFNQLVVPFEIGSSQALELSLANIKISQSDTPAMHMCQ
ncbi:glycoside hydrolase family 3 protein [Pseudoalteromonas piratica]|uniref:Beta-glucosidase n=1 Tax=Pseudoalteromonas piratica TaxID=1348114 RepID=A0A0A7ENH8_9GAMM|nr:beta-glucosidase [Pseudoalteromonas piratica]